jgi:hypothetical protein
MRVMFWNIKHFGKPSKRRQIKDFIREEKLDGVGLQETIKSGFSQRELEDVVGVSPSSGYGRVPRGTLEASSWE